MERLTKRGNDNVVRYKKDGLFLEPCEIPSYGDIKTILDRLAYYEDMEEQGRLKIFPCQVGDKAYWINGGQIKDCKVHRIQVNRKGTFLVLKSTVVHGAFNVGMIGHTVFLTREEAEQALATDKNVGRKNGGAN